MISEADKLAMELTTQLKALIADVDRTKQAIISKADDPWFEKARNSWANYEDACEKLIEFWFKNRGKVTFAVWYGDSVLPPDHIVTAWIDKRGEFVNDDTFPNAEVGDKVFYVLENGEARPAFVVRKWSSVTVNLQVLTDGSNDGFDKNVVWKTSVVYNADKTPGTWHFPTKE